MDDDDVFPYVIITSKKNQYSMGLNMNRPIDGSSAFLLGRIRTLGQYANCVVCTNEKDIYIKWLWKVLHRKV